MFAWNPSFAQPAPPARWMLPEAERAPRKAPRQEPAEAAPATQIDMFGEG